MIPSSPAVLPAAILWDLDGTLVDTEPLWIAAETEMVASFGGTWTHEDALGQVGSPIVDTAVIFQGRGVNLSTEEIIRSLVDTVHGAILREGPPWQPGARELVIAAQDAGIPQAIVTMSYRNQAEAVAQALPTGAIRAVVAGDMVTHGKPHPEPYLTAAERLGVDITRCVAVEDSETGATSAYTAGARTVVVPSVVAVSDRPGLGRLNGLGGVDLPTLIATAGLSG